MLKHHHAPPPHHARHHHDILFNLEDQVSPMQLAQLLGRFADQIEQGTQVALKGHDVLVSLPDDLSLTVRYERTKHGSRAWRISAEWDDKTTDATVGTLAELLQ